VIDGSKNNTSTVGAGTYPYAIEVNPTTNKIYIANVYGDDVTVIDGETNDTDTIDVSGSNPNAIGINPNTNKIYVANDLGNSVTIIDGETNDTTSVAAGNGSNAVGINPNTNKIYVSNGGSNNVTVIDGATNNTTTVTVGDGPCAVAVNPTTNRIYIANRASDNITVIDGETNDTAIINVGDEPCAIGVNPNTNRIYVANNGSDNAMVIDGATNGIIAVAGTGIEPVSIDVNPTMNKIYIANQVSNSVTVIDGITNVATTFAVGDYPSAVRVNPNTNKIYVANQTDNNVTIIDGFADSTVTISAGTGPGAIAVNPITNKIYVANKNSNNVTVIDEAEIYESPLESTITPLIDNETTDPSPQFTGTSTNSRTPTNCNVMKVLYQFETTQGEWEEASIMSGGGTPSVGWLARPSDSLRVGFHSLYVFALDSTAGTINLTENFTGGISAYYFLVKSSGGGIDIDPKKQTDLMLFAESLNMFTNSIAITYQVPEGHGNEQITLRVYNLSGTLIKELVNKECAPGIYSVMWDCTNLNGVKVPSGIYFYNLITAAGDISRKSIILR
jgi:YVTN family beta-propeller protein